MADDELVEPHRDEPKQPAPSPMPDQPLGDEEQFFLHGEDAPLDEQLPRYDEHGNDIRMYTGEPVETEDGIVIPQQMNVGRDNMAGSGEWPDADRDDDGAAGDGAEPV